MSQSGRPQARFLTLALGVFVVAVAAFVRFFHLDFGLRQQPDYDERIFVENALGMISRGDWDHRFYEYPGLFLWILRVVLGANARGADAYFASRVVVVVAAISTVLLVFKVVSSWVSLRAGFVVSMLLALSALDVETAHMVRPDTVIAPLLFAALALASPREGKPRQWLAWALAAVATAVKFSAALVFVPLVLACVVTRTKPSRVVGLALMAVVFFAMLSPYTFIGGADSLEGMRAQLDYHYQPNTRHDYMSNVIAFVTDVLPRAISWPGLALAVWGAFVSLRARARWTAPWITFAALWILTFSTTEARYGRFAVPVIGTLCLLAALGLEDSFSRFRIAAIAGAAAALVLVGASTKNYLSAIQEPMTLDRALDWVSSQKNVSAVGSTVPELGALGPNDAEIVPLRGFHGDPFLASQFDALVMLGGSDAPVAFETALTLSPSSIFNGPPVTIFRAKEPRKVEPLDLNRAHLHSTAPERDAQLTDSQVSTRWRLEGSSAVIEISWDAPVLPTQIEFAFGAMAPERELQVKVSDDTGPLETESIRPPLNRQHAEGRGFSQRLAWRARSTRALHIDLAGAAPLRIGELRVFADAPFVPTKVPLS